MALKSAKPNCPLKAQNRTNMLMQFKLFMLPSAQKVVLLTLFSLFFLFSCQTKNEDHADTILMNGNVYTVDEKQPTAQAIAIKDGLIQAVGTNEEIEKWKTENK